MVTGRRARSVPAAAANLLVAAAFTACATTTPPETEKQKKARSDLEQCNVAAGNKALGHNVSPEGHYSFRVQGIPTADAILACMTGKGYSGVRVDSNDDGPRAVRGSGGEGRALQ
jgi:hypothetical protein